MKQKVPKGMNLNLQKYGRIEFRFCEQMTEKASRFTLWDSHYQFWIPRKHLEDDMTLKVGENIDYVFRGDFFKQLACYIQDLRFEKLCLSERVIEQKKKIAELRNRNRDLVQERMKREEMK